jgi:hypothetical protein
VRWGRALKACNGAGCAGALVGFAASAVAVRTGDPAATAVLKVIGGGYVAGFAFGAMVVAGLVFYWDGERRLQRALDLPVGPTRDDLEWLYAQPARRSVARNTRRAWGGRR